MAVKSHPPRVDAFTRRISWFVSTKPGAWFFTNVSMRVDRKLMPVSRGRVRMSLAMPSVLLTHRGAKSGVERTTPILYFTDGDDVVVIASNGGAPRHPAWLHNMRANPDVQLSTDGRPEPYVAREVDGEQRARLWRAACEMYPGFGIYQQRAGKRQIPVVVCSPKR